MHIAMTYIKTSTTQLSCECESAGIVFKMEL